MMRLFTDLLVCLFEIFVFAYLESLRRKIERKVKGEERKEAAVSW